VAVVSLQPRERRDSGTGSVLLLCAALFIVLCAVSASATTYYVDATNGSDSNDGTSNTTAWKTIAKVNAASFNPGDSILFKRGETWREQLNAPSSGNATSRITFGAYGSGAKPIVSGADLLSANWTPELVTLTGFVSDPNIHAYWMLEEAAGANRTDGTGHANTLVDHNTVGQNATHKQGSYSAQFTRASSQYLSRADASLSAGFIGKSGTTNSDFTYGAWVLFSSANDGNIFQKGNMSLTHWGDGWFTTTLHDSGGWHTRGTSWAHNDLNTWHHVVVRYTGSSTKELSLFIDGKKESGSTTCTDANVETSTADLQIGGTGAWSLDGLVDEVFVFNRALNDSEILQVYNGGLAGSSFNAYYTPLATSPTQTFANDTRLPRAASKDLMTLGTSYYDSNNTRIYVRTPDDTAPGNYTMTRSVRDYSVLIDAKDSLKFNNLYIDKANARGIQVTHHSNNLTFDSVDILGAFRQGLYIGTAAGGAYTIDNVVFANGTASYCGGAGVAIQDATDFITITNNSVHHNNLISSGDIGGVVGDHDFQAGIKLTGYESDINQHAVIERNTVYSNGKKTPQSYDGSGIWLDGPVVFATIRYNRIYDNTGNGIRNEDLADDNEIYNNLVYDNMNNDIEETSGTYNYRNKIYNNIAYSSGRYYNTGIMVGGALAKNNSIRNNIAVGHYYGNLVVQGTASNTGGGSGNVYEYNSFGVESSNFIWWNYTGYSTYSAWEAAYCGSTGCSHSMKQNPTFVNAAGFDFHPLPNSSAIDAGTNVNLTSDFAGNPVPSGAAPDIGAYEYQSNGSATYYVDATGGNDSNNGLSNTTAWKTIAKVNAASFNPGDTILFKRGGTWRETLTPGQSGTSGNPITFGAYDTGANPIISGSDVFASWTVEGSYWYAASAANPYQVFYDAARLVQVYAKGNLGAGKWWWDSGNHRVYIGSTPSSHTLEVSQRDPVISGGGRSYIVYDSLTVKHAKYVGIDLTTNANHNTVQNCVIEYNYVMGIQNQADATKNVFNTFQDNEVRYQGGNGIWSGTYTEDTLVRRNNVHHNCILNDQNVPYGNHLYTAGIKANTETCLRLVVEYNYVHDNGIIGQQNIGSGIWFDYVTTANAADAPVVRYNYLDANVMNGIQMELTSNSKIHHNIVLNSAGAGYNMSPGILIYGRATDYLGANYNLIYNNMFYGNDIGIWIRGESGQPNSVIGNVVKNNIAVNSPTGDLFCTDGGENDGTNGYGNVYEYNSFGAESNGFIVWNNTTYNNYGAWEAAYCGSTNCSHSMQQNPQFVNATGFDFHPLSNSPVIDAGVNVNLTADFDGNSIPSGAAPDIGAFEYQFNGTSAPLISSVVNSSITNRSAVITWTTNQSANETIRYGTTTALSSSKVNASFSTNHTATLSGLTNNTRYYYNITACNSYGYCTTNGTYNFLTLQNTPITTYYVDATGGNDSNSGTSNTTAWRTIAKVNAASFNPGDTILFKRGETWREYLTIPSSGNSTSPITFGAYGSGSNPIISGADMVTGWSLNSTNIWSAAVSTAPRQVFFNGTRGIPANYSALNAALRWNWSNNVLYVYSTANPSTVYTSPGVEASARGGCIYSAYKDYYIIDGLTLQYSNGLEDGFRAYESDHVIVRNSISTNNAYGGFQFNEADYGTINNCTASYNGGANFDLQGAPGNRVTNATLSNNTAHHARSTIPLTDGVGLKTMYVQNSVISNNIAYSNDLDGIDLDGGSGVDSIVGSINNEIYGNVVHDNNANGIQVEQNSSSNKIYRNLLYDNGNSSIMSEILIYKSGLNEVYDNVAYKTVARGSNLLYTAWINTTGTKFYNNVGYGANIAIRGIDIDDGSSPAGTKVKNNIMDGVTSQGLFVAGTNFTGFESDYNIFRRYDGGATLVYYNGTTYTLPAFFAATGQDEHSLSSNPLFVNASGHNFHLNLTSPAIDAGTDVGLTTDYDGYMIVDEPDIGAMEVSYDRRRFFANTSPWNTPIPAGVSYQDIPGFSTLSTGLTSWSEDSQSTGLYFASINDPVQDVLYNYGAYDNVVSGAWNRTNNSAAVEAAILAGSSDSHPYPGNYYSTQVVGKGWNNGGLPNQSEYRPVNLPSPGPLTVHIPNGVIPSPDGDGHLVVIQPDGSSLDAYAAIRLSSGQVVSTMYSLTYPSSNGTAYEHGRRASFLTAYGGILRDYHAEKGAIDHAISIIIPGAALNKSFVYPALCFDSNTADYNGTLPMGARLAIPTSVNLSTLNLTSAWGHTIALAAQTYGFYVADRGGGGITLNVEYHPDDSALAAWNGPLQSDLNIIFDYVKMVTETASEPLISSVQNTSITNQSAVVTWSTNIAANETVRYGTTLALASSSSNTSFGTSHSMMLSGLTNNTRYYYNITACNSYGNCSTNGTFNFTTSQNTASTTYYVDATGGNDSNDGLSNSTPWRTIDKVNGRSFSPGDQILFKRGGTWRERLTVPSSGNATDQLVFGAYGNGAKPIISGANNITAESWTLSAANIYYTTVLSTDPTVVWLDGASYPEAASSALVNSTNRWFWSGGDARLYLYATSNPNGFYDDIEAPVRPNAVSSYNRAYVTYENLEMRYGSDTTMYLNGASSHAIIQDCTITGAGYQGALRIKEASNNCTVQRCTIVGDNRAGVDTVLIADNDGSTSGTIIQNCTIKNGKHSTLKLMNAASSLIQNNIIKNDNNYFGRALEVLNVAGVGGNIVRYNWIEGAYIAAGGAADGNKFFGDGNELYYNVFTTGDDVGLGMATHSESGLDYVCINNKVYNNVIYGFGKAGLKLWANLRNPSGNLIKNNIIFANDNDDHYQIEFGALANTTGFTFVNNTIYDSATNSTVYQGAARTVAYMQSNDPTHWSANLISDPKVTNAAGGNFTLQANSPCVNAGTNVSLTSDFAGTVVPQGSAPDMGAYEFISVNETPVQPPYRGGGGGGGGGGAPPAGRCPAGGQSTAHYFDRLSPGQRYTLRAVGDAYLIRNVTFSVSSEVLNGGTFTLSSTVNLSCENVSRVGPDYAALGYERIEYPGILPQQITTVAITFVVPLARITAAGGSPEGVSLLRYDGAVWKRLPTSFLGTSGGVTTYAATSPGLSIFAVALLAPKPRLATPTNASTNLSTLSNGSGMPGAGSVGVNESGATPSSTAGAGFLMSKSSFWVVSVFFVLVVGGLLAGYFYYRRRRHAAHAALTEAYSQAAVGQPAALTDEVEVALEKLRAFITRELARGHTKAQIRAVLLKAGWQAKVVDRELAASQPSFGSESG